jgi:translation elongation factor P/translation initiation factor 5A
MIQFYNVKKKERVEIDPTQVTKHTYEKTAKNGKLTIRYALKAVDADGTKLTKFCSKADYDAL